MKVVARTLGALAGPGMGAATPTRRDRKLQGQRLRIKGLFFMRAVPDRQPPGQMRRAASCVAATVMFR
ncbi:hypothetical protein A6W98_15875 [Rhodovulum sulfidophilum DSM 1374]|nr:hypothetical protein A6W98_15875 [Rhodovulum sulfidophilum DSM 1374]